MYLKLINLLFILSISGNLLAQLSTKKKVEQRIPYLIKDPALNEIVHLDNKGITLYNPNNTNKPEITVYWNEINYFLKLINHSNYNKMIEYYESKGTKPFHSNVKEFLGNYIPETNNTLDGLKIAIDPGHFANSVRQAYQEDRLILFNHNGNKYPNLPNHIFFYESNLNYLTAQVLKKKLEEKGAIVFISRSPGNSAVGKSFDQWYNEEFHEHIKKLLHNGSISKKTYKYYNNKAKRKEIFYNLYKQLDFTMRSKRINSFNPDLTVVIHYNASDDVYADDKLNAKPVHYNYSTVFIPGSFLYSELRNIDARIDFLRLLLSDNLEKSYKMAKQFIKYHEQMGIPPLTKDTVAFSNKSIFRGNGIYHRNLYLTRSIKSPIIYGESLLQNNIDILEQFSSIKKSYNTDDLGNYQIKIVADAYYKAINDYISKSKN